MPALVAGIHVLLACGTDADGRDKPGHDESDEGFQSRSSRLITSSS